MVGETKTREIPAIVVEEVVSADTLAKAFPAFLALEESHGFGMLKVLNGAHVIINPDIADEIDFGESAQSTYRLTKNAILAHEAGPVKFFGYNELLEHLGLNEVKPVRKQGKGKFSREQNTQMAMKMGPLAGIFGDVLSVAKTEEKVHVTELDPTDNGKGHFVIPWADSKAFVEASPKVGKLSRMFSITGYRPFVAPIGEGGSLKKVSSLGAGIQWLITDPAFPGRDDVLSFSTSKLKEYVSNQDVRNAKVNVSGLNAKLAALVWASFANFDPNEIWLKHNPDIKTSEDMIEAFMVGAQDSHSKKIRRIVSYNLSNRDGAFVIREPYMRNSIEPLFADLAHMFEKAPISKWASILNTPFTDTRLYARAVARDERFAERRANR